MQSRLSNIKILFGSSLLKNSFWGLLCRVLETLFLTVFFVILSKQFSIQNFADFLIATNIYQLVVAFASMGLGNWFIRELELEVDKENFINRYFKTQLLLGISFYFINAILICILYTDPAIRLISLVIGINILFDNALAAIRNLNIAQAQQKRSAIIMAIDGFIKFGIGCLLFVYPFSIFVIAIFLVIARFFTLSLFFSIGSSNKLKLSSVLNFKLSVHDFTTQVFKNWRFVVIVGLSIVFWRSATIIISKFLSAKEVAEYEIAYKIFSVFIILPLIASATIYPKFVNLFARREIQKLKKFYQQLYTTYLAISLISYAFIQSFSDKLVLVIFGPAYFNSIICLKHMFLTFLVFPTALLQANLLIAMKLEKKDMYFNMVALVVNFSFCFIGFLFFKSLRVVNYSIFAAFSVFHILQTILLLRLKIASLKTALLSYGCLASFILSYGLLQQRYSDSALFICTAAIVIIFYLFDVFYLTNRPRHSLKGVQCVETTIN